jgi:hypothetical protein
MPSGADYSFVASNSHDLYGPLGHFVSYEVCLHLFDRSLYEHVAEHTAGY